MIVNFFEPPPAKKVGGLEPAIRAIEAFLCGAGVSVRSNPALAELGKSGVPEIVHFHGLWEPSFLRISAHCRRAGIPYVVSPHGMLEPWVRRYKRWKKWPWFQLFERHHLAGASRLLTTSDIEARNLGDLLPDSKCVALPLGLTADSGADYTAARRTLGWKETETILLFLSRIHQKKGLNLLLQALAGLDVPEKQSARLVIVGGGENAYLRELMDFVAREQTRLPRIDWVGEVWGDEKWAYFQGADLFCLPSFSENFGLAVLEALQVGTRVLTTNQTPWTDVPSWGAGFVTEPTEMAVRDSLEQFFARPEWPAEQRTRLAAQIRARYAWDTVGPGYLCFYEEIFCTDLRTTAECVELF
ncbi:MAG: glycosyltransferase [Acidobacteriota bacterium]